MKFAPLVPTTRVGAPLSAHPRPTFSLRSAVVTQGLFGRDNSHVTKELDNLTEQASSKASGRKEKSGKKAAIATSTESAPAPVPKKDLGEKVMDFFSELGPIVSIQLGLIHCFIHVV